MANILTKNPLVVLAGLIIGITVLTMVRANAKDKAKKDAGALANNLTPGNTATNGAAAAAPAPAKTPAAPKNPNVLRLGSKSEMVKALQRKLGITADGDFGPRTEAAVKDFQKRNGLTPDGIAGPATLAKLYADRPGDLVNMTGNYGGADGGLYNTIKPGQAPKYVGPIAVNPVIQNPYGMIIPRI